MEEIKKPILNEQTAAPEEEMKLDDARRVKVLSPGMLVFKRFIRNKLAIAGTIILVIMFLFAFVGPLFTPYSIAQQFTDTNAFQWSEYATVMYNNELRYTVQAGKTFSKADQTALMLAFSNYRKSHNNADLAVGEDLEFTSGNNVYYVETLNPAVPSYVVRAKEDLATVGVGKIDIVAAEYANDPGLEAELRKLSVPMAPTSGEFEYDGKKIAFSGNKMERKFVMIGDPFVLATENIFDSVNRDYDALAKNMQFCVLLEEAMRDNLTSVTFEDKTYNLEEKGEDLIVRDEQGADVMTVSELVFGTARNGVVLTVPFKEATPEAVRGKVEYFEFPDENGNMVEARLHTVNANIYVETQMKSELVRIDEPPSQEHLLGLDHNGMDVLTRLMYGGRISLMVGFVVIFFETFIGVIIGGISGYFGGWVDTALMRLVDLFNAIPFYPMVIIMGSVMDAYRVSGYARIFFLMVVLGVLGWTGIARVTRGQILSLREQDFMVATEATGIRTSRKIFRHLIPNVMPLLIVNATMGLGGVIISEATLGFLGLGVKYPLASWGSIINQATDMYVMRTCWWIWIPAGCLIMLSVLGFNFVGDGLRDAYDPKMKR